MSLVYAHGAVVGRAWRLMSAGAVMAGVVIGVFGWAPADVVAGTLAGIAVRGGVLFFAGVLHYVPRGPLAAPPPGARIVDDERAGPFRRAGNLLLVGALCVVGAYLGDRWDMGAIFVPGQLVGYGCAYAVAAALLARWERKHGERVVIESDSDEDEPGVYAI
jgi:hypothetical protein